MDPRRDRRGTHLSDETPALSVVIPVYNEGENVAPTLRGVVEQSHVRPLEVLVVHDFDEDTTVPVVKRLLTQVTIESRGGFELGLELTVKAYRLGMRVAEVPTTWRDRTAGESRFKLVEWLPRYLHWYWRGIVGRVVTNR